MAAMTPERITSELERKAAAGITKATSAANQAQLDGIIKARSQVTAPTTPTTVTAAPPADTGFKSTYTGPDVAGMTNQLNQAIELRKSAELDSIRRQRETALQGYNKMETQTKQQAYDNRNSADVVSMQNAQRLRQSMADMGLINSGDNITAQAQGNAQRQGAIGSINRDESNSLTDIGERRNLTINQAAGDERSLIAGLEAERLNRMIALQQYGDQALRDQDNINYGRFRDGVGDTRYNDETAYNRGRDTLGDTRYTEETTYNRGIDQRNFDFEKANTEWQQNFQQGQFDWQKASDLWQRSFQEKNFAQQVKDAAASRGLQWAGLAQRDKERIADQLWKEKTFNADQGWKQKTFDWETSPGNPSNMPKTSAPSAAQMSSDYVGRLNTFSPDQVKTFFKNEQSNVIKDIGINGYNQLYGLYFDQYGFPKK